MVYGIHLARTEEEGKTIWQTKMHAIIAHKDSTARLYRESDLRKVRRLYINDSLHQGQLQENFSQMLGISNGNSSSRVMATARQGSCGKSNDHSVLREEDSFQVDLRVHGVSHDVTNEDKERMTKIQTLVDNLQDGCRTNYVINDLGREGKACPVCSAKHQGAQSIKRATLRKTKKVSTPILLEILQRRNSLLHMWCMSCVFT